MALPELTRDDVSPELAEIVDYRKSGLSLNHIVGCPLDCAYCVRHIFDNFQMRIPHRLLSDESAVEALLSSRYFRAHRTPLQILNRATDPLLPAVKPAVFKVLQALDARGLTNHVLVISRYRFGVDEAAILNELRRLWVTLLFTWSGIEDRRIEPVSSKIAAQSMRRAYELAKRYRVVQYWRPLVHGLNDTDALLQTARENARNVHATAFTGLFFRREIETFYRSHGLSLPYTKTARRKILPEVLERRVLAAFEHAPLFRKRLAR